MAKAGYAIVPALPNARDVAALVRELDGVPRSRAGARGLMRVPSVAALAEELVALASAALGADAVPFKATLFDKSRGANWAVPWHQDTVLPIIGRPDAPGWGPFTLKASVLHASAPAWALENVVALRLHLDDSGPANGPLRVIPGAHKEGLLSATALADAVRLAAPVECHVPRGGVMLMRPLIVHSSSRATHPDQPRRVLHVEYSLGLALRSGIRLAVV